MWPFTVTPLDIHPQDLCDALPPAEVQRGIDRTPLGDSGLMPDAMHPGPRDEHQQPGGRVVVGCVTPMLCRAGVVACGWPNCCGKTRR